MPVQVLAEFLDACMEINVPTARMWMLKLAESLDQDEEGWQEARNKPFGRDMVCGFTVVLRFVMQQTIESLPPVGHEEERRIWITQGHQFLREVHRKAAGDWGLELGVEDFDGPITWEEERRYPRRPKEREFSL